MSWCLAFFWLISTFSPLSYKKIGLSNFFSFKNHYFGGSAQTNRENMLKPSPERQIRFFFYKGRLLNGKNTQHRRPYG